MGRNWPPNSFAEWMVGQNFRVPKQQATKGQRPIIKVEISEDETSGAETVAITYPRRRRRATQEIADEQPEAPEAPEAPESPPPSRKVRFDDEKPLKSALKKTPSPNSSDDTLVDTSDNSEDATTTTTDDDSSNADETDTSEDDAPTRPRRIKSKKCRVILCQKESDSEDSSAAKDVMPHETCRCKNCKKGRKMLRAILKFQAQSAEAEKRAEAQAQEEAYKKEEEAKAKDDKKQNEETKAAEAIDTGQDKTIEADTTEDDKKRQKEEKEKEERSLQESKVLAEKLLKAVNKAAFKLPKYPKEMEPNLIMPVRSKVMQVEHTLEGPDDPRPNAFFDAAKGITRVYHGPQYGNHLAELYGKYHSAKMPPGPDTPNFCGFPPGWTGYPAYPHPPWPFAYPPGTPFRQKAPAMNFQPPGNDTEMQAAAAKGFGLSGQPAPQTPAVIRQFKKEEQQKAASNNASKSNRDNWTSCGGNGLVDNSKSWGWVKPSGADANPEPPADAPEGPSWDQNGGAWDSASKQDGNNGNTGWDKPSSPGAKADPPADASQGQNWSGSGDAWNTSSKQTGVACPINFESWGNDNGKKFERLVGNKNGSQKAEDQTNSQSGKPDSQPAGPTNGQSAKGSPKKAADGSQGGDKPWGQSGEQDGGWATDNQPNNDCGADNQKNVWNNSESQPRGGPPGSKPASQHHPSPRSNMNGGNASAWQTNEKQPSPQMPGGWGPGSGKGSSPRTNGAGAFDWPKGQGPPVNNDNNNGWQGGGRNTGASNNGAKPAWPSKQMACPSNSWQNPDIAQYTGGAADNW